MNKDFIVLENGFVIRKSYVNIVLLAYNADDNMYRVDIHYPGDVITSYYSSERDANNELKRLTSQLLEKG
jgi:hypothetical protein